MTNSGEWEANDSLCEAEIRRFLWCASATVKATRWAS